MCLNQGVLIHTVLRARKTLRTMCRNLDTVPAIVDTSSRRPSRHALGFRDVNVAGWL
jgi:hypothetical protein